MKILKVVSLFSFVVLFFMYCTKTDQVVVSTATKNTSDLLALKTATAPTIDGVVDLMWANAEKLDFIPGVPDPGNGLFAGYIGDTYPVSLRAMYDNENIYFLAEYADKDQSQKGNLVLVANIIDNDVYGNIEAETTVPWGKPLVFTTNYNHRSLFARRGHSPIWLELLAYGIIVLVWAVIIYLGFQIRNIIKLGLD